MRNRLLKVLFLSAVICLVFLGASACVVKEYDITFVCDTEDAEYIDGDLKQHIKEGQDAIAPIFEKEGYNLSWDKNFTAVKEHLTVKAVFTPCTYKVVYYANGGSGFMAPSVHTYNSTAALAANVFTKTDARLRNWNTESNGTGETYEKNATVTNLANTQDADFILYAIWNENTWLVEFDSQGGSNAAGMDITLNTRPDLPVPSRANYKFEGWYGESEGVTLVANASGKLPGGWNIRQTTKLYAAWSGTAGLAFTQDDEEYAVSAGTANASLIAIPEYYNGKKVTKIDNYAFAGKSTLSSVLFTGITEIGTYAFQNCTALTNMPNMSNITKIGMSAFSNCIKLNNLTINNISITELSDYIFANCRALKTLTLPTGLTKVGESSFLNCSSLETLNLANVTVIGVSAFEGCNALTAIELKLITQISDYAFNGCSGLITARFVNTNLSTIGNGAFKNCISLTELTFSSAQPVKGTVVFPSSIITVGDSAFKNCFGITSADIRNIGSVGAGAFNNCRNLGQLALSYTGSDASAAGAGSLFGYIFGNELNSGNTRITQKFETGTVNYCIPDALTSVTFTGTIVKYGAFSGCLPVTGVSFSAALTKISDYAFAGCGLTQFSVPAVQIGASILDGCAALTELTVKQANDGIAAAGDNSTMKFYFGDYLPQSLLTVTVLGGTIYENAFKGYDSITHILLDESIGAIGKSAFSGCSSLISIEMAGVATLGDYAFKGCGFISFDITGLTCGVNIFEDCESLAEFIVPSLSAHGLRYYFGSDIPLSLLKITVSGGGNIISGAFKDCGGIKTIILTGITVIGSSAFENCTSLLSITMTGVTAIGADAFKNCGFFNIDLSGVVTIGAGAFENCSKLLCVYIPDSVTSIGASAFKGCALLSLFAFENGINLPAIAADTFSGCINLTAISIPDSVLSIGAGAFKDCAFTQLVIPHLTTAFNDLFGGTAPASLKKVTVLSGDILADSFKNCKFITEIILGSGVTEIGEQAFAGCIALKKVSMESVTKIGVEAFLICSALNNVDLGGVLEEICSRAFASCSSLTVIYIPASILTVAANAFENCINLGNNIIYL